MTGEVEGSLFEFEGRVASYGQTMHDFSLLLREGSTGAKDDKTTWKHPCSAKKLSNRHLGCQICLQYFLVSNRSVEGSICFQIDHKRATSNFAHEVPVG